MPDKPTPKPRGRPIKNTMPEPIPDTPGEHRAGNYAGSAQEGMELFEGGEGARIQGMDEVGPLGKHVYNSLKFWRSLPSGFVSTLNGRQVPADAPGDPCRGGLDRVPRQMRVSGSSLNLGVA